MIHSSSYIARQTLTGALSLLALVALTAPAAGQAFCALRDPKAVIEELFPEGDGYGSIVRTVGKHDQEMLEDRTRLKLHYSEFGCHTLYVARKAGEPLGFVRVRAEASDWGLTEIAWSFDLSLRVRDFRFQRCRDPRRSSLDTPDFRDQLRGKTAAELSTWIDNKGDVDYGKALRVPEGAEDLARAVVRSGLKTLLTTDLVWPLALTQTRMEAFAHASVPDLETYEWIEQPYGDDDPLWVRKDSPSDRARARAARVLIIRKKSKKAVGCIVRSIAEQDGRLFSVLWHFDAQSRPRGVRAERGWPSDAIRAAFEKSIRPDQAGLESRTPWARAHELAKLFGHD